jgi:tRNA G18 (ribose-2'-O)-methylase SpoU
MPALPAAPAGVSVYRLTAGEWEALSQDPSPEGVMAVAAALPAVDPAGPLATGSGTLLLLYQVNNPNNLGALFRMGHWPSSTVRESWLIMTTRGVSNK